jgi:hypothetical protein
MSNEQLKAVIPGIVDQLATAVEVSCTRKDCDTDQACLLCVMAKNQLYIFQRLYQNGARTFWIHNTGPIGCLPVTQHYYHRPMPGILDQHGCVIAQNDMAKEFNRKLKSAVIKLREQLPDAAFTYVDVFAAKYKLISNARKQGNIC